jgi:predicted phosphate transport protein (TIGR00153 family)
MAFRLSFFPRDEQFFVLFGEMADEIKAAAVLLEKMLAADPPDESQVALIRDAEHRCDALTHDAIQRLHRTFVTPFDREDLYALASSLDTVMDSIDHAAVIVQLYRIKTVRPEARTLTHIVSASAARLHQALDALAAKKPVQPHAVEINRLENEADRLHQEAVGRLFANEKDPIAIIKWKEIFDFLEGATDRCEEAGPVVRPEGAYFDCASVAQQLDGRVLGCFRHDPCAPGLPSPSRWRRQRAWPPQVLWLRRHLVPKIQALPAWRS